MKLRRTKKKNLKLQVTSLLDMFTIILVFLMVSFQAEDRDFILNSDLTLPASTAKSPIKAAVNVAITTDDVVVDGSAVASLQDGRLPEDHTPISEAVQIARESQGEENTEGILIIQADQHTPYQTISGVMNAAAAAGLYRYRLVIEKE